jgi:hypothetical protein
MRPIATPAAGLDMGTPASIRARLPPHTVAIEDDPNITDTNWATTMVINTRKHKRQTTNMAFIY